MSNLNMNAQDGGRVVQATDVPTATGLGNRIARPLETAKVVRGTFGDASGEMAAAEAQMKAAQQVNAVVQDSAQRLANLQIAEEESNKQLYQQEWHVKEKEARASSRQKAIDEGLDTDGEQQAYLDARAQLTDPLRDKYKFSTRVGNDIEQRVQLWGNSADAEYTDKVVVPRRVDNIKAGHLQALEGWGKALADSVATEKDPVKLGQSLAENKQAVYNFVRSPQFVAVWGAAGAEQVAQKYINSMQLDAVTTMTNNDPQAAVLALRNQTGDPATDPLHELDPSVRRQMLYQAEKEASSRAAEQKALIKEKQDKREAELTMAIVTGELSGNKGVAVLHKAWTSGEIDQSHFERGITKLQMEADRRERRAQAAADRAARAAEKRDLLLAPARDAIEMGLPLDPKNPSHVKSAEAYAQAMMASNPKADKLQVLIDVTQKTGVAPRSLTSLVYSKVNSKDPKEAVQGTQILAGLAEKAPNVIHSLNEDTVSKANQIAIGVHPEQAQANIERMRSLTKEQKEEYKKLGMKHMDSLQKELKNSFGLKKGEVTPEAYGHARDLFQDQLIMSGGNVEAAMESTKALMRKSYNVSHLTGKPTLMFNAPEGAGGKSEWMTTQFANDLKGIGLKPEQVRLKANAEGSYDMYVINNGVATGYVTDPKTGRKLTWEPDQEAAAKQVRESQLAEAKKKRDEYLNQKPNPLTAGVSVSGSDVSNFVPRGVKPSSQLNTTEQPQFGKFKSETK